MTYSLTACYYSFMGHEPSLKEVIAANIAFFRENNKLDQFTLGRDLGYKEDNAQSRISQYEKLIRSPGKKTLQRMADRFGVPVGDLMRPWDSKVEYRCLELYREAKTLGVVDEFAAFLEGITKLLDLKKGLKPLSLPDEKAAPPGKLQGSSAS